MSYLQSILLGILQGIAEFLPISSSGHLAILEKTMGIESVPVIYDIFLHVATLLVILIYFWKLIFRLLKVIGRSAQISYYYIFKRKQIDSLILSKEQRWDGFLILSVILGTLVTFSGYMILDKLLGVDIENLKSNKVLVYSLFIITGGLLLFQAFFNPKRTKSIRVWQGMLIGFGQIFGLFPGISRSGATISAAVISGVDRKRAGEISFLLSIPAIAGSLLFKLDDIAALFQSDGVDSTAINVSAPVLIAGMAATFAAGMLAFPLLLKILQKRKLYFFSIYLIPLGIVGLILELT